MLRRVYLTLLLLGAGCSTVGSIARPESRAELQVAPVPSHESVAAPGRIQLALSQAGDGRWIMRATVTGASRVEIAGDFSDWDPVALARERANAWTVRVRLAPGVHQVALRADGGSWVAPAGLPTVTDEFGGVAGVLVVPAGGDAEAGRGSPSAEGR